MQICVDLSPARSRVTAASKSEDVSTHGRRQDLQRPRLETICDGHEKLASPSAVQRGIKYSTMSSGQDSGRERKGAVPASDFSSGAAPARHQATPGRVLVRGRGLPSPQYHSIRRPHPPLHPGASLLPKRLLPGSPNEGLSTFRKARCGTRTEFLSNSRCTTRGGAVGIFYRRTSAAPHLHTAAAGTRAIGGSF